MFALERCYIGKLIKADGFVGAMDLGCGVLHIHEWIFEHDAARKLGHKNLMLPQRCSAFLHEMT